MKNLYLSLLVVFALLPMAAKADEGMWTFDNLPVKQLKEKYNFEPTQQWVEHLRLSSVRFQDGGSGSFVSSDGLVMTNHHVAVFQIQKLSTPENDLVQKGFYADSYEKEMKTKDYELNVLIEMQNVTDRVKKASEGIANGQEAQTARRAEMSKIEDEQTKTLEGRKDGKEYKSHVVSFYGGNEYWLYTYKVFRDVRLVFAPERQAAYFGGDYDNFTYPRWDLDVTFFRVYEDGKPLKTDNYLKWKTAGANPDELVFISGHPGSTDRQYTMQQVLFVRDVQYPIAIEGMERRIKVLEEYAKKGPEQARQALVQRFAIENGLKATRGTLEGLQEGNIMRALNMKEQDFRMKVQEDTALGPKYGDVWDQIQQLVMKNRMSTQQRSYRSISSQLFNKALLIVRYHSEKDKPAKDRMPGFSDAQLEAIKGQIVSPAPIQKDMDSMGFAASLQNALTKLPPNDEFFKAALQGKDREQFAEELFAETEIEKVDYRTKLANMKPKDFIKVDDPMIQLARRVDTILRRYSVEYDKEIAVPLQKQMERLSEARFAVYGRNTYPDANFTLRLTYGTVKGYPYNGTLAPPFNTLYGLYDRSLSFENKGDFELPARFWEKKNEVDLSTRANFVTTNDIIGGNSGSPIVNKNGEVVGIVFDGNYESLPGRYIYDMTANRAVGLYTSYIIEAMRKLYGAGKLADELERR